jgi:hypothetical protein
VSRKTRHQGDDFDGLALGPHPPELKPLGGDRLLDDLAGEFVRRSLTRPQSTGQPPGTVLGRKLGARIVTREGVEAIPGLGGEHEDAHGR